MDNNSMSIGDGIREFLKRYRLEDKITEVGIEDVCRQVLGEDLGRWISRITYHQGTLFLDVAGAAMRQELSYHKSRIRDEINTLVGKEVVQQVKVR